MALPWGLDRSMARILHWARNLRSEIAVVYVAARDPRVPWYAKLVAAAVAAYALSPIDLIPDFIPIAGHLDDAIIVPLGLWLAIRLIPPAVLADIRSRVATGEASLPKSRAAATVVIALWLGGLAAATLAALRVFGT